MSADSPMGNTTAARRIVRFARYRLRGIAWLSRTRTISLRSEIASETGGRQVPDLALVLLHSHHASMQALYEVYFEINLKSHLDPI